jgi:exodeoxyribonuclease VII small subunit
LTAGRVGGENGVMSKKALKFEEALARLEGIADEIEQGKIGLEESIARYEEGMKLVQRCQIILDQAEQRITRLQAEREPAAPESAADGPEDPNNR